MSSACLPRHPAVAYLFLVRSLTRSIMLTMPGSRVRLPTYDVRFPPVCPHCLGPAKKRIVLKTKSEFAGFFVLYTKWRHWRLSVPFCRRLVLFPRKYIDLVGV